MFNEFETICKNLNECKRGCRENLYVCAEEAISEYVGTDRKKLLQIKAQAEGGDFYSYSSLLVANTALLISFVNAIFVFPDIGVFDNIIGLLKILMLGICTLYMFFRILKFKDVLKWRKYILVAISEIEREWK